MVIDHRRCTNLKTGTLIGSLRHLANNWIATKASYRIVKGC